MDLAGGRSWRPTVLGALLWVAVHAVAQVAGEPVPLVPSMLALATVVILPSAVSLHPNLPARSGILAVLAGSPLALALLLDQGWQAGLLVLPWLGATVVAALVAARAWWRRGRSLRDLPWAAACAYAVVGALWALADRLGVEPGGFGPPLVALTAIHFHYAGAIAAVLAASAHRRLAPSRMAAFAVGATVAGPPLVAVGFAAVPAFQIAGALALALGLWVLSILVLVRIAPSAEVPAARVLLSTSALAVIVPMLLAVQWALGWVLGTPALSIPDMARWHGAVNAIGFGLAGVLGWRLVEGERP